MRDDPNSKVANEKNITRVLERNNAMHVAIELPLLNQPGTEQSSIMTRVNFSEDAL